MKLLTHRDAAILNRVGKGQSLAKQTAVLAALAKRKLVFREGDTWYLTVRGHNALRPFCFESESGLNTRSVKALEDALVERALTMTVHPTPPPPGGAFVVWLHASDDPVLGTFIGEGASLAEAIEKALLAWDGGKQPKTPGGTVAAVRKAQANWVEGIRNAKSTTAAKKLPPVPRRKKRR